MPTGDLLTDICDRGDGLSWAVVDRLTAGIDAGEVAGAGDSLSPCEEISGLIGGEAAALLLIEKEDGMSRKSLSLCCGYSVGGVLFSKCGGCRATSLLSADLSGEPAIGQYQKAEAVAEEDVTLSLPVVLMCAGRIVQPVSGEAKVPP
jgi:hypothetical protein